MDLSRGPVPADPTRRTSPVVDGALALGFLALALGVTIAYWNPAETYELSIYSSTPATFWFGVGVALLASLAVAIGLDGPRRQLALGLGGAAFVAVTALPFVRGYHFYGDSDSLTHLGYLRDLVAGAVPVREFFYPGLHTLAIALSEGTGFSQERSLLFVVFVTAVLFATFVPLTVRALLDDDFAVTLAAFAGMMLLPVNHVATHYIEPHSMSQTILLFPLALFLLVRYVQSDADRWTVTPTGVLLAVVAAATVLFHPLQATVLVILFLTVVALQVVARWRGDDHPIAAHRPLYGQSALLVGVFSVWALTKPAFWNTVFVVSEEARAFLVGDDAQAGAVVSDQSASLAAIGAGITDAFLKLFLVCALFAVLAGGLALRSALERFGGQDSGTQYLAAALFTLVPPMLFMFVGDVSKLSFRFQGSIMVIVTILGTVALYRLVTDPSTGEVSRSVRFALVAVVALLLLHSMLIVYMSPYMYNANRQVSEAQLSGYEGALETGEPGVKYDSIRGGPGRYMQAVYGVDQVPDSIDLAYHNYRSEISGEALTSVGEEYDEDHYLVVSKRDRDREIGAYRSLRYSEAQIDSVATQRDVHRIRSNGPFTLYQYDADRTEGAGGIEGAGEAESAGAAESPEAADSAGATQSAASDSGDRVASAATGSVSPTPTTGATTPIAGATTPTTGATTPIAGATTSTASAATPTNATAVTTGDA